MRMHSTCLLTSSEAGGGLREPRLPVLVHPLQLGSPTG